MKVLRSQILGFCAGVRRAVDSAEKALAQYQASGKKIYSLGPLIHNQSAMQALEDEGLEILEQKNISSLNSDCLVIIRAHGVPPLLLRKIKETGAIVIDSTCPRVSLSQRRAAEFSSKGFVIILAGDKGHAEVNAIAGSAGENFILVQNASEAASLCLPDGLTAAVLLSQTTFSPEEFHKISDALSKKIPSLQVFDTICPATQGHQKALRDLSRDVDAIVVVGGKKSANSNRLFETARSLCKNSFFVETAADLPDSLGDSETVGITAGASTPDSIIREVETALLAR